MHPIIDEFLDFLLNQSVPASHTNHLQRRLHLHLILLIILNCDLILGSILAVFFLLLIVLVVRS